MVSQKEKTRKFKSITKERRVRAQGCGQISKRFILDLSVALGLTMRITLHQEIKRQNILVYRLLESI